MNQGRLTVNPAALSVTATGIDKVYDGTATTSVTLGDDRLSNDHLTLSYAAATFADPNAGIGKQVTVSGIAISGGADAGNYVLANTSALTTATISPAAIGPEISHITITPSPVQTVAAVTAAASDANTGNYNILAAEYFVDSPGVDGKGRAIAAMDKKFNSPSEAITAKLDPILAKLSQGSHTLYVHAKDASGKWGPFATVEFRKDTLAPVTSGVQVSSAVATVAPAVTATIDDALAGQSNVVAAEFFIDKVGKSGKGAPMNGSFDSPAQAVAATISDTMFNALSQGKHTIYVHGTDALGHWGKAVSVTFTKDTLGPATASVKVSPSSTKVPPKVTATIDDTHVGNSPIVAAEYFIDVQGESGTGLAMTASDGRFSGPKENVLAAIDAMLFASLASGKHTIYVHGEDVLGHWGSFKSVTLQKTGAAVISTSLQSQAAVAAPSNAAAAVASARLNDAAILALFADSTNSKMGAKRDVATVLRVVDTL